MNQQQYQNTIAVKNFTDWLALKSHNNGFRHRYTSLKPQANWECHSLYNAYEAYSWPFFSFHPLTDEKISGKSYQESSDYLDGLQEGLRNSVITGDDETALKYCRAIMKWGGVLSRNEKALARFTDGNSLSARLKDTKEKLSTDTFTTTNNLDGLFINSGFSKIYALLIDDFVIYDSRVGAALGLLVRQYCEEGNLLIIPDELLFAYADAPPAKGHKGDKNVRNPSRGIYSFPKLNNHVQRYLLNNMKANWLINGAARHPDSAFSQLPPGNRMRALEAALFMVGYKVW